MALNRVRIEHLMKSPLFARRLCAITSTSSLQAMKGTPMSLREFVGLILTVAAIAIAPFGYWLSPRWYLLALLLGVPGTALFFTARNARRFDSSDCTDIDTPFGRNELRGFAGAKALDRSTEDPGDD
jgi:Flp pilus assembly protein TadB